MPRSADRWLRRLRNLLWNEAEAAPRRGSFW